MRSPFRSILTSALTACTSGGSKRALSSLVSLQEISIPAADGTILAAQRWTKRENPTADENDSRDDEHRYPLRDFDRTILCTHGWLDNCGSHHYLAPRLAMELESAEVIAMDFPGHGWSSHRSKDAPPLVNADFVYYVCEAIQALQSPSFLPTDQNTISGESTRPEDLMNHKWATESGDNNESTIHAKRKITLLGHSLGAGVVSLTAAAFPELVDQVVLLDAATFLPREAKDTAEHVRTHILRRRQHDSQQEPRVYPNLERAIQVRQLSATKMPGNQSLSYKAAREIVRRGTRQVGSNREDEEKKDETSYDDSKPVQFRHDPRFTWPSIQYMTWEQNEGILEALGKTDIDICLVQAENGWPVDESRIRRVKELLQPKVYRKLPGNHHFHANPESAEAVGDVVIDFLRRLKY